LLRFIYCFYGLATFPINRGRVRKHECSDDTNNAEELYERFIEPKVELPCLQQPAKYPPHAAESLPQY
jgi:hypothetical protein